MTTHTSKGLEFSYGKTILLALSLIFAVVFLFGGFRFFSAVNMEKDLQALHQDIASQMLSVQDEQGLAQLSALLEKAQLQNLTFPEANYTLVYRQWEIALKRFNHLLTVSKNPYLAGTSGGMVDDVRADLFALRDTCSTALKNAERERSSSLWKLYNLRGCVSIMLAYTILEFEEDGQKSKKFLGDATEDFKQAIQTADLSVTTMLERNIPRWNLELIVGQGQALNVGQGYSEEQTLSDIKDQLQATLPNIGGYAPGVPLETRVEK